MVDVRTKYAETLARISRDLGENLNEATQERCAAEEVERERAGVLNTARAALQVAFAAAVNVVRQMFLASVFKGRRNALLASGFGDIINTLTASDAGAAEVAEAEKAHREAVWAANAAGTAEVAAAREAANFQNFYQ